MYPVIIITIQFLGGIIMKKELQDCMTSELLFQAMKVAISDSERSSFLAEYERRLKMMDLTDEQIVKFREADETSINNGCYIKPETLLVTKPFIEANMNVDSIKVENCTFSELVYLTDDANSAFIRDHHWLPKEAWHLVCQHALNFGTCKSAIMLHNRMESIGLTEEQIGIFIRNECQIAKRLRWHYSNDMAWC